MGPPVFWQHRLPIIPGHTSVLLHDQVPGVDAPVRVLHRIILPVPEAELALQQHVGHRGQEGGGEDLSQQRDDAGELLEDPWSVPTEEKLVYCHIVKQVILRSRIQIIHRLDHFYPKIWDGSVHVELDEVVNQVAWAAPGEAGYVGVEKRVRLQDPDGG